MTAVKMSFPNWHKINGAKTPPRTGHHLKVETWVEPGKEQRKKPDMNAVVRELIAFEVLQVPRKEGL